MRVLVTGADGFVGRHLCSVLKEAGDEIVALAGPGPSPDAIDVRDGRALREAFSKAKPHAVVHLAAVASVANTHTEPGDAVAINAVGAANVLFAARELGTGPRILIVSSGEVYGALRPGVRATEESPLAPVSPYAASKVAAEVLGFQFARSYGLHVVCARPFNHLGLGQAPTFAIPSFAAQIAAARHAPGHAILRVGNLEPVRDFSHVSDVVAAYRILLDRGVSGEAYNVCSGDGRTIRSVLNQLIELAGIAVDVEVDPAKLRPADIPTLVGDATKMRALGWVPTRTTRDALEDVLREADKRSHRGTGGD